ncbi:hypothetical protein WJX84_008377, partial [Apatococcus fuscideae]
MNGEVTSTHKVDCVFKYFDADLDGALNQAELDHFIRSVNPGVPFNDSQVSAITSEVYSEYSDFLVNGGLSLAGLHQTYADGIGDIHRDFATLDLGDDHALQDITPKVAILEESKQQTPTSSPHRTRFVPAPIVKASSGPLPTPLALDSQPRSSQHQQAAANGVGRLGHHGATNENDACHLQPQQQLPSRAAPAGTASARRLGNEEMRQADALVHATRGTSNAGVAGMIARFEPSQAAPAEPPQADASQSAAEPSAFQFQAARPAAEQVFSQPQLPGRRSSDTGQPHATQPQLAAGPSGASSQAQPRQNLHAPLDQSAQPQEMQRHIRRNLSNAASLPSPADTNAVFDKFMEAGFRAAS